MAYENLGTPTGNNLYITIPLRGTDNWDEKLKDGFFQRVVDHDHTPGRGAAIVEAALEAPVQTKLAQIATNTSEIAQNATNIQQNAAEILTNAQDISSNDTDIAALDSRVTTAESNISSNDADINLLGLRMTSAESDITALQTGQAQESIEIFNQSDANALANTTVETASIIIKSNSLTVSNVTFKGCDVFLEETSTFTSCSFLGCDIKCSSSTIRTINFNETTIKSTSIQGFNQINLNNSSTSDITLEQVTVPTSFSKVSINATNTNRINLTDCNIQGYDVEIYGRSIIAYTKIDVVNTVKFYPIADNTIRISSNSLVRADVSEHVGSEFVRVSDSASIFVRGNGGAKFKTLLGATIIDSALLSSPPYKVINEVYSAFDAGLVPSGTPSNGDTLVYNSTSGEWETQAATGTSGSLSMQVADSSLIVVSSASTQYQVISTGADYNPNNTIVNTNQFEAPSTGFYVFNVSAVFSTGASQGSDILIFKNSVLISSIENLGPGFLSSGDQLIYLTSGDLINITIETTATTAHSVKTDYTIKKIS